MTSASIVIIARSEHVPALRRRLRGDPTVSVFGESESLHALAAILAHPPNLLALDSPFITTARGAALIARVKTASHLADVELRVLTEDDAKIPNIFAEQMTCASTSLRKTSLPINRFGTRRVARFPMNGHVDIVINGERSQLVNLSVTGAQALVPMRLRPEEPVRILLPDGAAENRYRGVVAWSVAEPSSSALLYRVGLQFVDPETDLIEAFCVLHGTSPDMTFGAA
jgi:PilZ domain-containing protein